VRILHLEPQWAGKLRCDAFRGRVIVSDPPWDEFTRAAFNDHVWTDEDDARLCNWMRRHFQGYNFDPSATDCAKAVQIVAESHAFHPVKDYLTRLVWDQEPRLSHWLSRYVGASPDDYTQNVARWWMVSAVARVLRPGCKADHVMILEGEQGIRKSSALKVLGGEWFTDTPIDMNSKDAYSAIRGVWIVELAELDSLMRVEASRAKAFFSSPVDRYRPAYGRREKEIPRQCVFAGTVNHREYLRDPTGARRFWPIACTKVDLDGLTTARDQLWAEAVWLFNNGARWWPEAEENEAIRDVQEEHGEQDAWTDSVREYLMRRREVSMGDILGGALGLEKLHWTRANETRVGAIMAVLGWRRVRRQMPDGTRPRFYIGPTEKHEVGQ